MKILIAPNAMKGSLSASEFANAIAEGLSEVGLHNTIKLPVADGGDGTASILANYNHAKLIKCVATDPLNRQIETGFYMNNKNEAFIEMADISGLKLLHRHEYSPLKTSCFGFGELIKKALQHGAKTLYLCVGGSATVDAGMGALIALGTIFYEHSKPIDSGCGENLKYISNIDSSTSKMLLKNIDIRFIVDVENPLLGEKGAAIVFAPQKGATPLQVHELETGLAKLAHILQKQTNIDVTKVKGGGAAGGIAASFKALFEAKIESGAEFVLTQIGFFEQAKQADLIITGEGCIDQSTLYGKAPGSILNFGTEIDIPVFGICGTNHLQATNRFEKIYSLTFSVHESDNASAMKNAYILVVKKAIELGTYIKRIYEQ